MTNNPIEERDEQIPGEVNAGDARASIYGHDEEQVQEQPVTQLHPGTPAAPLQEAAHGDPDEDLDMMDEEPEEEE